MPCAFSQSATTTPAEAAATASARSRFLINAEGKVVTPSTTYFLEKREKFRREADTADPGAVVLLGDSLTANFPPDKLPSGMRILNRGIGGDKIGGWKYYGVLDRIDCCVAALKPSKVFLMIGINDLVSSNTPEDEMTSGIRTLLSRLGESISPRQIYVQSVLPLRGKHSSKNPKVDRFNEVLKQEAAAAGVHYLDIHPLFENEEGELSDEYTSDGLHLNPAGYSRWADAIAEHM